MSLKVDEDDVWPEDSLQHLKACPVCGSSAREQLFSTLKDIIFKCAPGEWSLYRCGVCCSAYLDPRPDEASIGRAYETYFTHSDADSSSIIGKMLTSKQFARAYNGRLNRRYGFQRTPASPFLGALLDVVPFVGHFFDPFGRSVPHLPFAGAKLLDFGCGDGRFVALAQEAGWDCAGIDFDPGAVEVGLSNGLNVKLGGVADLEAANGFDRITLSHVIEHVHDPRKVIQAAFNALNPGGVLWMETPNIDAFGHARFGANWRGLDCPRHLVIFTPNALADLMKECGFSGVVNSPRIFVNLTTYSASERVVSGHSSHAKSLSRILKPLPIWDGIRSILAKNRTEFIQITGRKP